MRQDTIDDDSAVVILPNGSAKLHSDVLDYYMDATKDPDGDALYGWHAVTHASTRYSAEGPCTLLQYNASRLEENRGDAYMYRRSVINLVRCFKQAVQHMRRYPIASRARRIPPPSTPKPTPKPTQFHLDKDAYKPKEIFKLLGIDRFRWTYLRKKTNIDQSRTYTREEVVLAHEWNKAHPPGRAHRDSMQDKK